MKNLIISLLAIAATAMLAQAQSAPAIDKSRPEKTVTFGLRAGMNSSGIKTNYISRQPELIQSNFYWHSGLQVGAVADLNLRRYLAVETGIFWERHGYDAAMMAATAKEDYMGSQFTRVRYNVLSIPILLSVRLNILSNAVWNIDFGPYFSYGFSGSKEMDSYIAFAEDNGELVFDHNITKPKYFDADPKDFLAVNRFDWGAKIGTGLTFFNHYTIGVYYQHSIKNLSKNYEGGADYSLRNCCWSVNLGYNF